VGDKLGPFTTKQGSDLRHTFFRGDNRSKESTWGGDE